MTSASSPEGSTFQLSGNRDFEKRSTRRVPGVGSSRDRGDLPADRKSPRGVDFADPGLAPGAGQDALGCGLYRPGLTLSLSRQLFASGLGRLRGLWRPRRTKWRWCLESLRDAAEGPCSVQSNTNRNVPMDFAGCCRGLCRRSKQKFLSFRQVVSESYPRGLCRNRSTS